MADKVISVILRAVTGPYETAMRRAAVTTTGFKSTAMGMSQSVGRVASSIGGVNTALIGVGGTLFAVKSVTDAATRWESAFTGVTKTVDGTETQLARLERGLRDMSTTMPTSAEDLAGIAAAAGQLGIQTQNVEEFTRQMAMLGETTNLSGEQGATVLARFANITQMSQDDFDRLASTIVDLGNNSATTESEIADMALRLAGAGTQVGFTEADILGLAATLSSLGIRAESGGTAFSRVMIGINDAVATSSDELQIFAQVAGTSAGQFAQSWRTDAAGALSTFTAGLGRLSAADLSQVLQLLGFDDIRVADALRRTAGAGDLLADSLDRGAQAWDDNTAAMEEFEKRNQTTQSEIDRTKNKWDEFLRSVGEFTKPGVEAGAGAVGGVLDLANEILNPSRFTVRRDGRDRTVKASDLTPEERVMFGLDPSKSDQAAAARLQGLADQYAAIQTNAAAAGTSVGEFGRAQEIAAGYVRDANGELQLQDEMFQQLYGDPVLNLIDAMDNLAAAQQAFNDEPTDDHAKALAGALMDADVAADRAAGKFGEVVRWLDQMEASGRLTSGQVEALKGLLDDTRRSAEDLNDTKAVITIDVVTNAADVRQQLQQLSDLAGGGSGIDFLLGRASGGMVAPYGTYVVGEQGPELLQMGAAGGNVIPAPQTSQMLSQSTVSGQVNVQSGAIQLITRDARDGMRAANQELRLMSLGYV